MVTTELKGPTHNVVIIGGSFGGLDVAHRLLKTVFPSLRTTTGKNYKVTMLTNSSKFFFKIGAPRALINPAKLPLDQALMDIAPGFEQYGAAYQLVLGYAIAVDPTAKTVSYSGTEGNASGSLSYDSLVIASGTSFDGPLWTASSGWEKLEAAYKEIHAKLETAKTMIIAGGGPTGVETAAEVAVRFKKQIDVTLLSGTTRLVTSIKNVAFSQAAETRLTKLGVKVKHNVRVVSHSQNPDGSTTVVLNNGESRAVDIYIPALGDRDKGNSAFVPDNWLTKDRSIKTVSSTLRLDVADVQDVYVIGAVGSYSDGGVTDIILGGYQTVCESFRTDQLTVSGSKSPTLECTASCVAFMILTNARTSQNHHQNRRSCLAR